MSGSGQIDLIALEATAEEYVLSYLNAAYHGAHVKSIDITLSPVQTTQATLMSSIVSRYTLSVNIIYLPSRGEDGPITITSASLWDLLLTQLGSDDFVSDLQEDVAQIGALIIDANSVPSSNPDPTPPTTCQ